MRLLLDSCFDGLGSDGRVEIDYSGELRAPSVECLVQQDHRAME